MDLTVLVRINIELTTIMVNPFSEALRLTVRGRLLQFLPNFLESLLHRLIANITLNSPILTFRQLFEASTKSIIIDSQSRGIANEIKYQDVARKAAKQTLRYLLWERGQAAIPEEAIDENFIISLRNINLGRVREFLEEVDKLPSNELTTTNSVIFTDSNQSMMHNPSHHTMDQSKDSFGIVNSTRSAQPLESLGATNNQHYINTPPFRSQPPTNNNTTPFETGAPFGYTGATLDSRSPENHHPIPQTQFPAQNLENISFYLSKKRQYMKLSYTYDGKGELEAFTFITAYHQATYRDNWSDYDKVVYFPEHLLGVALQWYVIHYGMEKIDFMNLKQEFLKTFAPLENFEVYTAPLRKLLK